mmetsp:Transcript_14461/g.34045  ORF Transcript_14461/g.34045 Transcript_14461/m.34045 type:complete len:235 (-) Transcript_14461:1013-1717(-)
MTVLLPRMVASPSSRTSPSTSIRSRTSGKLPVVMMVPDTSGRNSMFCPDGSSTASDSVRSSLVRPSNRSGWLPPIAELISKSMRASGRPNAMSSPSKRAPPRNVVSPTKRGLSSTSGRFPVVTTVPSTSGRLSERASVGFSTASVSFSLAVTDCGRNVIGNGFASTELTSSDDGNSLSPMVTALSMRTSPRRLASPTTEMCSVICGSDPVVTIVPPLSGGNSTVRSDEASGSAK